jgi:MFS family permease
MKITSTKNFNILMIGRFVSGAGSYFDLIALNLFVLIKTNSPLITGLSMATRVIAGCATSPYLGRLADKIDRKFGMILSDAVLGIAMILLAIIPDQQVILAVFIIQALLGIFQNYFLINFQAALPVFAPYGNLIKANSWFQATNCSTIIVGAIGATAMIGIVGYRGAFILDGLSYLFSLIILLSLPNLITREAMPEKKQVADGFFTGMRYLLRISPFIFFIFFVRMLDGIGSGSHNVALPIFSTLLDMQHPNKIFGLILTTWGVGSLTSSIIFNFYGKSFNIKDKTYKTIFIYSTALMSVFWILVFQISHIPLLIAMALLAGIFDTTATITYSIILQKTADTIRGRVMAMSTIVLSGGLGIGMALSALMTGFLSPAMLVLFWHGIPIIIITGFILRTSILKKMFLNKT